METKIVSAFPGTGKSYYFQNSDQEILDSDSSTFDKQHFPENYIKHIKDNIGKADIIFVSSHEEVREALINNGIQFILIYPDISLKNEYIRRYEDRGNNEKFVELISSNWEIWLDELQNQKGCFHVILKKGQYIQDVIQWQPIFKIDFYKT